MRMCSTLAQFERVPLLVGGYNVVRPELHLQQNVYCLKQRFERKSENLIFIKAIKFSDVRHTIYRARVVDMHYRPDDAYDVKPSTYHLFIASQLRHAGYTSFNKGVGNCSNTIWITNA